MRRVGVELALPSASRRLETGAKMIFPGIKNETEAKNLWAYVNQFSAEGKPKRRKVACHR